MGSDTTVIRKLANRSGTSKPDQIKTIRVKEEIMARMNMSGVAASALLVGLVAASPRVLVKVVDINGDAVPNAEITITGTGFSEWELTANNGGVARTDLVDYDYEPLTFTATSPDGDLEGTTVTSLRKTRGMNVVRVVVEEVGGGTEPVPAEIYIEPNIGPWGGPIDGGPINFTITAAAGTFQLGDIIVVNKDGIDYSDDSPLVNPDGSTVLGSVPFVGPGDYTFTVVPDIGEPSIIVEIVITI